MNDLDKAVGAWVSDLKVHSELNVINYLCATVRHHLMYNEVPLLWFIHPSNLATILLTITLTDGIKKTIELVKDIPYPIRNASMTINVQFACIESDVDIILHIDKNNIQDRTTFIKSNHKYVDNNNPDIGLNTTFSFE